MIWKFGNVRQYLPGLVGDLSCFGEIWKDLAALGMILRDLASRDRLRNDATRLGKIFPRLGRFTWLDLTRFGAIWYDLAISDKICQRSACFGDIWRDWAALGTLRFHSARFPEI